MFPDTAAIYMAAIEDQDYKDEKINCEWTQEVFVLFLLTSIVQSGRMCMDLTSAASATSLCASLSLTLLT